MERRQTQRIPDAVCFCLEGAILRALTELGEVRHSEVVVGDADAELMGSDENICE